MKKLEEIKKANAYPLVQVRAGNACVECDLIDCECYITAEQVDCLIKALERAIYQRDELVDGVYGLNGVLQGYNKELEQILEGE